ncbi:hypothetical protein CDD83_3388 [Cordyceps sp. RAO-2017]|nr:hypothetical protein CDD83_3388 [Cordyceps sp. RAO-2017]
MGRTTTSSTNTASSPSSLPALTAPTPYDLVFLDADKPGYGHYVDVLLAGSRPGAPDRLLRPGALVIADNVLRGGHVADPSRTDAEFGDEDRWQRHVQAVRDFNDKCLAEPRLDVFMVPLWDGVSVMRLCD